MMKELIGNTPLYRADGIKKALGLKGDIFCKLEMLNPAGSSKDRAVLYMLEGLEKRGEIKKGGCIIEPTSGNTGIALAALCPTKGYRAVVVMPDSMSLERRALITAYGAELVLTNGSEGMLGAIKKAEEIKSDRGGVILGQFENEDNIRAHYESTGPEILKALPDIDGYIACIGTGATVTGAGRFLKEKKNSVKVIGVEPTESPLLTKGYSAPHGIQGIGANFIPKTLDISVCDAIETVSKDEAYETCRLLSRTEGLLAGISSGAALCAAARYAKDKDVRLAVILPDSGRTYLSDGLF